MPGPGSSPARVTRPGDSLKCENQNQASHLEGRAPGQSWKEVPCASGPAHGGGVVSPGGLGGSVGHITPPPKPSSTNSQLFY